MGGQGITNGGVIKSSQLSIGSQIGTLGNDTTLFNQSTNWTEYLSLATSGSHRFFCNTATPTQVQTLQMTATAITTPCSFTSASILSNGLIQGTANLLLTGVNPVLYTTTPTSQIYIQGAPAATTYGIKFSIGTPSSFEAMSIIPTGTGSTGIITMTTPVTMDQTLAVTGIATFTASPTAPTPIITDNSTKVATTAFIKQIAAPVNFAGLGNSFFNSFLYSTTNPSLDYMIAGTLGGLAPVTAAAIIIPSLTTYILMGIRLQAGINFNRYAWNQQSGTSNLRCALYTSQFVYVPNSISTNSVAPTNAGGKVEVITAATITIPVTDTYYIYMDSSNAATTANSMYGATTANVNVCNYLDVAVNTFTALTTTVPFKVSTGVRVSGSAPTTNTDLKIGALANMTYQSYVFGIFIQYTV
jgi:hypothetical protein